MCFLCAEQISDVQGCTAPRDTWERNDGCRNTGRAAITVSSFCTFALPLDLGRSLVRLQLSEDAVITLFCMIYLQLNFDWARFCCPRLCPSQTHTSMCFPSCRLLHSTTGLYCTWEEIRWKQHKVRWATVKRPPAHQERRGISLSFQLVPAEWDRFSLLFFYLEGPNPFPCAPSLR